ncbi:MAG: hypothetical protein KAR44_10370 [Candidatus Aegiribacteria sp.]|nr:hypothetical protein [Candidatus Aegiribacteria sp.]
MNNDFDAFAEDLLVERNPRPLFIVGAAKVDNLLFQTLTKYLLDKTAKSKNHDELLEGDRPLSTFSARIKLSYRLGLIDSSLFKTLEKLRTLRNICAHSIDFRVSKSPVREHIKELRKQLGSRQSYHLTRKRYFDNEELSGIEELQCLLLVLCVLLEAIRRKTRRTRAGLHTRTISSK